MLHSAQAQQLFPLDSYYFHSFAVRCNKNLVHHAMRWFWQKERGEAGRKEGRTERGQLSK